MKSLYQNGPKIGLTRSFIDNVNYATSSGYAHVAGSSLTSDTSWSVTQNNHGYTTSELPIPVYWTSTGWQKAIANAVETLGSAVIISIVDENTFKVAEAGRFTIPNHGLEIETFQYVSTSTAGVFVSYEPVNGLSNPLLLVEDENVVILYPYRPEFITETSTDGHIRDTSWLAQQTNHGFTSEELPIPVFWTSTGWNRAKADIIETLGNAVIVEIVNDNVFRVAETGRFTIVGHGLEVETFQYVSTSVAGEFVVYEPVNGLSNLLAYVEDENTVVILPYRPMFIAETSTGGITRFVNLLDVPHTYVGQGLKYVRVNNYESGLEFTTSTGSKTFIELQDAPHSYSGEQDKIVKVNSSETGLEFVSTTSLTFDVNTILTGAVTIPGFQSPGSDSLDYYGEFYFVITDVDGNILVV